MRYKSVNSVREASELMGQVGLGHCLKLPHSKTFYVPLTTYNVSYNDALFLIGRMYNKVTTNVDIFHIFI